MPPIYSNSYGWFFLQELPAEKMKCAEHLDVEETSVDLPFEAGEDMRGENKIAKNLYRMNYFPSNFLLILYITIKLQ